jgi:hypothetical protein
MQRNFALVLGLELETLFLNFIGTHSTLSRKKFFNFFVFHFEFNEAILAGQVLVSAQRQKTKLLNWASTANKVHPLKKLAHVNTQGLDASLSESW